MRPTFDGLALLRDLTVAALLLSPIALGQSAEDTFYKAHYLHQESGDLESALELYKQVARSSKGNPELAKKAKRAIGEINEDLACADFTRLMPPETIFYAELNHPGQRLGGLLQQLGLVSEEGEAPGLGISPRLLDAALDLRGAAIAITEIDPNGGPPNGVLVLHPGNQDALRGLIETAIGNGGQPVDGIHGLPTWSIEGEAYVTLTRRLLVAGRDRGQIAGVLERMGGQHEESFAQVDSMRSANQLRGDDLLFFHVNAEPILPWIKAALDEEAKHDPDVAMVRVFLDPESLVGITGRVGVSEAGLGLDLNLELEEGHQNLAFNLLRTPAIEDRTLRDIPSGVAFFLATSLNQPAPVAPPSGRPERPIVTAMDFGREVFANIVDVTVYGMPPEGRSNSGMPIPDVVASISVNDGRRSRALWNFVLNLVSKSTGNPTAEPSKERIAGHDVERYSIEGVPVFLATGDRELLISPSRSALERTFAARKAGSSVLDDPLFGESLESLGQERNTVLLVSPARCVQIARQFAPQNEVREMEQVAAILQDTIFCVGVGQINRHFNISARVGNVPDVSPLIAEWMQQQRGQVASTNVAPAPAVAVRDSQPAADFETLVSRGELDQARQLAKVKVKEIKDDSVALNDFAWSLLTEERYAGQFDAIALKVSERSNELTNYSNWALLDTLALAEFKSGHVEKAVKLQRKAIESAQGTGRESEVEQALKRYERALGKSQRKEISGASLR